MVQITTTKQISWDCVQVTLSMGSSFFIRTCYLQVLPPHEVVAERILSDEEVEDILEAGTKVPLSNKTGVDAAAIRTAIADCGYYFLDKSGSYVG